MDTINSTSIYDTNRVTEVTDTEFKPEGFIYKSKFNFAVQSANLNVIIENLISNLKLIMTDVPDITPVFLTLEDTKYRSLEANICMSMETTTKQLNNIHILLEAMSKFTNVELLPLATPLDIQLIKL